MADDGKKKGLLGRFGFKSKDDKLAEEAAERAAAQQKVDAQMAARMAAINAAALKSARAQDETKAHTPVSAEIAAQQEAEDRARAQAQAQKDVEAAKRLAAEKRARDLAAQRLAEEDAAFEKSEQARHAAEAKANAEKLAAEEKQRLVDAQKRKADEKAALAKAKKERGEAEAKALAERLAREAKARDDALRQQALDAAQETARKAAEESVRREAELKARREAASKKAAEDAALLEAEREARAQEDLKISQALTERRAREAQERAANLEGGFLDRISTGLSKSTTRMSDGVTTLFNKRKLDDEAIEALQDLLITSDLGVGPAIRVTDRLSKDKFDKQISDMDVKIALADVISDILSPLEKPLILLNTKPQILLFVGVNGSGKTTTLGKLAKRYADEGKTVLLAAGDTFRAAAVEQLKVWGERSGAPVVSGSLGADAAGLIFDAVKRAKDENFDVLMIDTAGRLQNRTELMDELSKVVRVIKKQVPDAPHHCVLVLDATVGQNALSQTEAFAKTAGVTGLIMTKLDGTAKGGVLVALSDKFKLPIHAIGIGEGIDDLENFSAPVFAAALSGVADALKETQPAP